MTSIDPLFVDCYEGSGPQNWAQLISAGPPWHGAIFKLTEGLYYNSSKWAHAQNAVFRSSPRYGIDLFTGFYHYLDLSTDGACQAEAFWSASGALRDSGRLWGMVDVERGGQRAKLSGELIRKVTEDFAGRYFQLSGSKPTLYGGEMLQAFLGPAGLLGCGRSAISLYGPHLPAGYIERQGLTYDEMMLWQYDGDGESYLAGYPKQPPGCSKIDISALIWPGGLERLRKELSVAN